MGLFLHFGPGPNQLPSPWQNLSSEHDIRKRLRFEDNSASGVFAEHVIEHVLWSQGFCFLNEVWRVLEPGGVLRISFPDISRLVAGGERITFAPACERYARALEQIPGGEPVRRVHYYDEKCRAAGLLVLTGWMHQTAWTRESMGGALLVLGFRNVRAFDYGKGELGKNDGHHRTVGSQVAELETTVIEATK